MNIEPDSSVLTNPDPWTIHLSYVIGYKHLDAGWVPAQHHFEFGLLDIDAGKRNWPVSFSLQLLLSYTPVIPRLQGIIGDYSGAYELNAGLRKVFNPEGVIQPHVAGGIGMIGAATTTQVDRDLFYQEENKSGFGYWGSAGFYWLFSDDLHTGIVLQYSRSNATLFGHRIGVGGVHVLFCFGWHSGFLD